jgi:hypothetical protein
VIRRTYWSKRNTPKDGWRIYQGVCYTRRVEIKKGKGMNFNTVMNTYLQDLQEEKKSKFDKLIEQRAFSLLVLANLRASVQRVEDNIVQIDKEILTFTDQDEKKQEISKFNRSAVIDIAEVMPIKSLLSLTTKLEDDKKQLEKNLNTLKRGQEFQVGRVTARIAEYAERIEIYREVYQNRVRYPVVDTEWA